MKSEGKKWEQRGALKKAPVPQTQSKGAAQNMRVGGQAVAADVGSAREKYVSRKTALLSG